MRDCRILSQEAEEEESGGRAKWSREGVISQFGNAPARPAGGDSLVDSYLTVAKLSTKLIFTLVLVDRTWIWHESSLDTGLDPYKPAVGVDAELRP